jgi:hypothetical protein
MFSRFSVSTSVSLFLLLIQFRDSWTISSPVPGPVTSGPWPRNFETVTPWLYDFIYMFPITCFHDFSIFVINPVPWLPDHFRSCDVRPVTPWLCGPIILFTCFQLLVSTILLQFLFLWLRSCDSSPVTASVPWHSGPMFWFQFPVPRLWFYC